MSTMDLYPLGSINLLDLTNQRDTALGDGYLHADQESPRNLSSHIKIWLKTVLFASQFNHDQALCLRSS